MSKRTVWATLPEATTLSAAAIAAPVDPVFAAIAQHIVARDALIEAILQVDEAQAKQDGREVTKADEDAVKALNLDEEAAFLDLLMIVPTTLEGRRAMLQHLVQRDEDGISEPIGEIAAKMLRLPIFAQEEANARTRPTEPRFRVEHLFQDGFNARIKIAYFDLEPDILELFHMAGIAWDLFEDAYQASKKANGRRTLQMSNKEFTHLQFAVCKTMNMASDLNKAYHKKFEEART